MKILVDELPYYNDDCPFNAVCFDSDSKVNCPRYWSKQEVCSDNNPHECCMLKEIVENDADKDLTDSDVAHIVRCENCKYYTPYVCNLTGQTYNYGFCGYHDICGYVKVNGGDFCSNGERKD